MLGAFVAAVMAVTGLVFGTLNLLVGWGMWRGKGWAWWLGIALAGIALVRLLFGAVLAPADALAFSLATSLPSAALAGFVLWYFTRPHVLAWFGRPS